MRQDSLPVPTLNLRNHDLLVVGDSNFKFLQRYLDPVFGKVIFWSGCTLEEAARRIEHVRHDPKVVVLNFGGNDLAVATNVEYFKCNIHKLLTAARNRFPDSHVYLCTVPYHDKLKNNFADTVNEVFYAKCRELNCSLMDLRDVIGVKDFQSSGSLKAIGLEKIAKHITRTESLRVDRRQVRCDSLEVDGLEVICDGIGDASSCEDDTFVPQSDLNNDVNKKPTWSYEPHARMFVDCTVGGLNCRSLLDGGSNHCMISPNLVPALKKGHARVFPCKKIARLANNSAGAITGKIVLPLNLGHASWTGEFFIMEGLPYDVVIGCTALKGLKATQRWGDMSLTVENEYGRKSVELVHLAYSDFPSVNIIEDAPSSSKGFTNEQKLQYEFFINKWIKAFESSKGSTDIVKHKIYLSKDVPPLKQRYYPVSPAVQTVIDEEIDKLLESDVIEPSTSGWSSPLVLVPKKNGQKRLCVDFRRINSLTLKNAYPTPFISTILDSLRNSTYVSSLDLKSGFHQIEMDEESKALTAFTVPFKGLFQYKKMPFGLCNAPATFQNLMDNLLRPLQSKCFVYMDDIIVIGSSFKEHLENLDAVFSVLRNANLVVNWEKSTFFNRELEFLGYVVGQGVLKPTPSKVEAVASFPAPRTVRQVRSFIGMCAWYKRLIPSFSDLTEPLTRLLHKGVTFEWGKEQCDVFEKLKSILSSSPIVHCPDFSLPFELQCDASNVGLGAIVLQRVKKEERVVAYASRTLNTAERNYSTTEKELCAILFAIEKFRPYVEGSHFRVITDHSCLQWLRSVKNPSGRLARWILQLQQFDFEVVHRKGRLMTVVDCLSRAPYNVEPSRDPDEPEVCSAMVAAPDVTATTDKWYLELRQKVLDRPDAYPSFRVESDKIYKLLENSVKTKLVPKLVVPKDLRRLVMEQNHSTPPAAHLGFSKTLAKIKDRYYWPNMYIEIKAFVTKCGDCQRFKAINSLPSGEMTAEPTTLKPNSILSVDIVGPLPLTVRRNMYILVCLDTSTRWVSAIPLRKATATAVATALLDNVFLNYGVPEVVMADNGKQFAGKEFKELCDKLGIKLHLAPLYYPRSNPVERANRTLKTALSTFAHDNQRNWDEFVKYIVFAMRTAVCESTGFTPSLLMFGREMRPLFDLENKTADSTSGDFDPKLYAGTIQHELALIYDSALQTLRKSKEQQATQYNLRHRPVVFKAGDLVMRRNFAQSSGADRIAAKLLPKWIGPFKVEKVLSPHQYQLASLQGKDAGRWPSLHLKPCR